MVRIRPTFPFTLDFPAREDTILPYDGVYVISQNYHFSCDALVGAVQAVYPSAPGADLPDMLGKPSKCCLLPGVAAKFCAE